MNRRQINFLICGLLLLLLLIISILGAIFLCTRRRHNIRYAQSQGEPPLIWDVDYRWTYDKHYSDMKFTIEIQKTSNSSQDPTYLNWTTPVMTKILSSSDYNVNGNVYKYEVTKTTLVGVFITL